MHHGTTVSAAALVALTSPATAAFAQDTGDPESDAAELPAEELSPSSIGTGAVDDGTIVVTARRREESSQDVPIAVSVVGGEHLDATGSFNVGRLQQLTPTLQFYSSNPRNTAVDIRGLGVPFGLTNDGIEQGVGIYVDDVYYSRVASATFDFLDVAQIQVLRGPQGTLYGKNTTAGAINITTRRPTFTPEGSIEASLGNLGFRQVKAALSGPVSTSLAARLALSYTDRDGTLFNVATGDDTNEQNNLGVRGQLLGEAGDKIDITFAADWSRQNPNCCGTVLVGTGTTQRPANRQFAALAQALGYAPPSTDPFERIADLDAPLSAVNELGDAALRMNWQIGPGTLTSISAWRYWNWQPANDRDFLGLPITTLSQNPSRQDQWTQELRYSGETGPVGFVLGAFAYYQEVRTSGTQAQGPAASRWLISPANPLSSDPSVLDGLTATNDIRLDNVSAALFGQLSWHITDRLTLQPGIRLNYDRKAGAYQSIVTNGEGQDVTFASSDPRIIAQRAVLAPQSFEATFGDWNLSYDFTASYDVADDLLAYATYAKSFKSGGINLNGVPTDASGNPILAAARVAPESVDHLEGGIKAQFLNRHLTANLAIFRTDIDDYQALVTNGQLGVLRGYLANAEKVRSQGVELDLPFRPTPQFNFYVNGAYTDASYMRFSDAPSPPELSGGAAAAPGQVPSAPATAGGISPENCDISGQRLPGISDYAFSFGEEFNQPVSFFGPGGEIYLGYDGSYRSNFSSSPSPSIYTTVDGYVLSNFRFGLRSDSGLDVFGWVRNAFDENYFEQLQIPGGNTGLIVGNPGDPRTYGVTASLRF